MQTYHYNRNYNIYGLILLVVMAVVLYVYTSVEQVSGALNIVVIPFLLGIFMMGYFTGQPCLTIYKTYFEYRRYPFGWIRVVLLDDILKVDISGKEILVYSAGKNAPVKIASASFSKKELPDITNFFQVLGKKVQSAQM